MKKKLVAIGGGECGIKTDNGNILPYETKEIDIEIIRLTEKQNPNFLFIGHAQIDEKSEKAYFNTMKAVYGDAFGCECKQLLKSDLTKDLKAITDFLNWSDIIYVGGGDTKGMVEFWKKSRFDRLLYDEWQKGKVICGLSAGANCWFKYCSSDSLKLQTNNPKAPMITVEGIGLINAFFTPHCEAVSQYSNRLEYMKKAICDVGMIGIGISNCCALEINGDEYRLIKCDGSNYEIEPYGVKAYYKDNEYYLEKIEDSLEYKPLNDLLSI